MSTYTTNTKPESKFEDVPEEVLTDPTMRTALGMDPIPGMNTPVDAADDICSFVNEHGGLNLKATPVNNKESLTVINEQEVLGRHFRIFGTVENPLFLAKDVAEWIEHSNPRMMLQAVDDDEKGVSQIYTLGGPQQMTIINESGLDSVILRSVLPFAGILH